MAGFTDAKNARNRMQMNLWEAAKEGRSVVFEASYSIFCYCKKKRMLRSPYNISSAGEIRQTETMQARHQGDDVDDSQMLMADILIHFIMHNKNCCALPIKFQVQKKHVRQDVWTATTVPYHTIG